MVVCAGSNRLIVGAGVIGVDPVSAVLRTEERTFFEEGDLGV